MNNSNQERAHNIIDEWHETTKSAAGDCVGYSESEWQELETLIAKALSSLAPAWSRDMPTKDGWYWYKNGQLQENVVQVYQSADGEWFMSGPEVTHCRIVDLNYDDEFSFSQWSSPLTPPEEGGAG